MIFGNFGFGLSPIVLSFMLIVYLLIIELGNEKMKRILMPIVICLGAVFVVVFVLNIYSKL